MADKIIIIAIPEERFEAFFGNFAKARGWREKIVNPDFDKSKEENETNPRKIPNTESHSDYSVNILREFLTKAVVDRRVSDAVDEKRRTLKAAHTEQVEAVQKATRKAAETDTDELLTITVK